MTRGNIIRLPLWLAFGLALGLALGPVADSLRLAVYPRSAWAAAGPTTVRNPGAATGTFTLGTPGPNVAIGGTVACAITDTSADTAANAQVETYSTFGFTATDVPATSTIDGITVILAADRATGGTATHTLTLQLVNSAGTAVGTTQATTALTATETLYTLGGAMSTWGSPVLAQTDIVSTGFGVKVTSVITGTPAKTISLYCLNVSVAYTPPANIQVADGVAPDGTGTAQGYGASVAGSLAAKFTQNTQTIYAGYIDVTNAPPASYGNFDSGYTLANVVEGSTNTTTADGLLNAALKVAINAVAVGTTCGAVSGTTVPTQGVDPPPVAQSANKAWVGNLIATPRTAINANGASERLCFYLILTNAPDTPPTNTIAGGTLSYNLTFTAS